LGAGGRITYKKAEGSSLRSQMERARRGLKGTDALRPSKRANLGKKLNNHKGGVAENVELAAWFNIEKKKEPPGSSVG